MKTILTNAFTSEGFRLTEQQLQQFEIYYHTLIEWNQKMNFDCH